MPELITPAQKPFVIPGPLVPYTRMTRRQLQSGKLTKQASRYLAFKDRVGFIFKEEFPGWEPYSIEIPLLLELIVQHPYAMTRARRKYDIANILKGIEDGLNKIAWSDDWQVIHYNVRTLPGQESALVHISPMN